MKFILTDRIIELRLGESITTVKNVSLAEEYLVDHFPLLPVMPGVLMLEAMYQSAAWLVRATDDFKHSMVALREVRNVKYNALVEPGHQLTITAEMIKRTETTDTFKARGMVDNKIALSGRLILHRYSLADDDPTQARVDERLRQEYRQQFSLLWPSRNSLIKAP